MGLIGDDPTCFTLNNVVIIIVLQCILTAACFAAMPPTSDVCNLACIAPRLTSERTMGCQ